MLSHLRRLARGYDAQLQRSPLKVKMVTSGIIVSASDMTAQMLTREAGENWDPVRTLVVGVGYGFLWFAPLLHVVTARMWPRLMPSKSPPALMFKTAVDLTTSFPLNVCVITSLNSYTRREENILDGIKRNLWPTWRLGVLYWGPLNLCMYGLVPMHYRVLFLNTFSYIWNTILIWRYK